MKLHGFVFASNNDDWIYVEFFKTFQECVDKAYEKYKELWADNLDCYDEDGNYCFSECVDDNNNKILPKREFVEEFRDSIGPFGCAGVIQMPDYHVWCSYHIVEVDV